MREILREAKEELRAQKISIGNDRERTSIALKNMGDKERNNSNILQKKEETIQELKLLVKSLKQIINNNAKGRENEMKRDTSLQRKKQATEKAVEHILDNDRDWNQLTTTKRR